MCEHFKSTNIRPGGFSEYVYLSEEHLENVAHLIPENLTEIEASFYEPLGCCVRAVKRGNLKSGASVLVIGLRSIGILR
jgi:L-iditol 2-dehydrogenase